MLVVYDYIRWWICEYPYIHRQSTLELDLAAQSSIHAYTRLANRLPGWVEYIEIISANTTSSVMKFAQGLVNALLLFRCPSLLTVVNLLSPPPFLFFVLVLVSPTYCFEWYLLKIGSIATWVLPCWSLTRIQNTKTISLSSYLSLTLCYQSQPTNQCARFRLVHSLLLYLTLRIVLFTDCPTIRNTSFYASTNFNLYVYIQSL